MERTGNVSGKSSAHAEKNKFNLTIKNTPGEWPAWSRKSKGEEVATHRTPTLWLRPNYTGVCSPERKPPLQPHLRSGLWSFACVPLLLLLPDWNATLSFMIFKSCHRSSFMQLRSQWKGTRAPQRSEYSARMATKRLYGVLELAVSWRPWGNDVLISWSGVAIVQELGPVPSLFWS